MKTLYLTIKKITLFALFVSLFTMTAFAQKANEARVSESSSGYSKGTSSGERLIEMNGYTLTEILKSIDPVVSFTITSDELSTRKIDFRYTGDLSVSQVILDEFNEALNKSLGVSVALVNEQVSVYRLSFFGKDGCSANRATLQSESEVNGLWTGECVTLARVREKILNWGSDLLIEVSPEVRVPRVVLSKASLKELKTNLAIYGVELNYDYRASKDKKTYMYSLK